MRYLIFTAYFGSIILISSICSAVEFPYREKYPEVEVIELTSLKSGYDKEEFILVDLRSETEFESIHINGAINLPYGNLKFMDSLLKLSRNNPDKKIAVYDNGIDCIKCYRAAEDALYSMVTGYAFDAGIPNWAKNYPASTLVYGKLLLNSENLINSDKEFNKKCLDFETFKQKATESNAIVIDPTAASYIFKINGLVHELVHASNPDKNNSVFEETLAEIIGMAVQDRITGVHISCSPYVVFIDRLLDPLYGEYPLRNAIEKHLRQAGIVINYGRAAQ